VSPARGAHPRAALLSQPPGAGPPATRRSCSLARRPRLPHPDSRHTGRVSRKARRAQGLALKPGRRTVYAHVLTVSARLRRPAGLALQATSSVGLGRSTAHCLDTFHRVCSRTRPRAACGRTNPTWSPPHVRRLGLGLPPGHPAPRSRTRGLAPGTDPSDSVPCAPPAMTDPGVPLPTRRASPAGPSTSSGPTTRVPHFTVDFMPVADLILTALLRTYAQRYSCQTNSS
jgi:hypothetical protein